MVCRILPDRQFGDNGMVNLVHAAHDIDMPLAGFTVQEIQFSLQNVLNVDMHADAYVDGRLQVRLAHVHKHAAPLAAGPKRRHPDRPWHV